MPTAYEPTVIPKCPHCGQPADGAAEDFVIPGRVDLASFGETQCGWCDKWFSAYRDKATNQIVFDEIDGPSE